MRIKSFIKLISRIDIKESVKSLFEEDFGEKDVELMVNGLAKRLSPELQSTLVISLIKYRNNEIKETELYLDKLLKDRDNLITIIQHSIE